MGGELVFDQDYMDRVVAAKDQEIRALKAENKRLRDAMEKIVMIDASKDSDGDLGDWAEGYNSSLGLTQEIAQKALSEGGDR